MTVTTKGALIFALMDIPPELLFHERFIPTFQTLSSGNIDKESYSTIFFALKKINPEKWPELVSTSQSIFTPEMDSYARISVINALKKIDPGKWEHFKTKARSFITSNMDGASISSMFLGLDKCDFQSWEEVYETARRFASNRSDNILAQFIGALGGLAPEKWETFRTTVFSLLKPEMDEETFTLMISALGYCQPELLFHERFIPTLQTLTEGLTKRHPLIIMAMSKIGVAKWPTIVSTTQSLITSEMDESSRAMTILEFGSC